MEGPGIIGLSGQMALRQQLDVVANNIANASTTAYRGDRMLFQSHISRLDVPGREVAFVQDRATYLDSRPGSVASTGNPLDVAIDGNAFLAVERPGDAGRGYTRDGRLRIAPDNGLVDIAGRPVLDEGGGRILMPERFSSIEIRADGTLLAVNEGRTEQVARIGLFQAAEPRAIRKAGDGLLEIPEGDARPLDPALREARLVQGALEGSSVQPITEIASLTALQRAYDSVQRIVADDDSRIRRMIEALGRPN
ncbi:flagellar hook basal-body protein [Roseomonas marmotae]|uniref:Flagellar hook basal-body protein n=1 Tax=Roseomonas marmotae TaxID=2768161 RepID=A0ABS3KHH6_9PROT|nr:flagellar hook basal-body protein [Roseomonas marmotae]MBO1076068.1 flagellar hook basal-body protein [Roseomonas marmotae]QTI81307.1 flagellar hook basal-body protein [Roseomonas marmotae]